MDPSLVPAIASSLGEARFARYLSRWDGRTDLGIRHYLWNIELSSAYWGPICILEVALRNAVHDAMRKNRRDDWWNETQLAHHEAQSLARTINKLFDRTSVEPAADDVVAATTFGFWVGMLSGGVPRDPIYNYETKFWQTRLHRGFPGITINQRKWLHGELVHIQSLRNRVAHHEPISHFKHDVMMGRIVGVLAAIDGGLADYVRGAERVTISAARKQQAIQSGACVL